MAAIAEREGLGGPVLIRPEQLAEMLAVDVGTLARWRYRRKGPPVVKLNGWQARYDLAEVRRWLAEQSA